MTSEEIKLQLVELGEMRKQVQADADQFKRLQNAAKQLPAINKQMDDLTAKLADVQAQEYKKSMEARFKDLRVIAGAGNTMIDRSFIISYKRQQWNNVTNETTWVERQVPGFRMLDADEMKYLLEFSPSSLPTEISVLAPGDPYEAMDIYLRALRRGYLDR